MISVLLAKKIAELFIYLFLGVLLVKTGVMKSSDAKVLSTLTLYLIMPCVILRSFQVDMTSEVLSGLVIASAAAVLIHVLYFAVGWAFGRFGGATDIEKGSVIYTNCGNLVLPIIISVIGAEWVIYQSAYAAVFNIMIWTHGRMIFAGRDGVQVSFGAHRCVLSHFSCVQLFAIPWTVACQAPLLGFSRQEYWSGLPFPSPDRKSVV